MCVINSTDKVDITMAFCSKCGKFTVEDAAFCKSCGHRAFCKSCGHNMVEDKTTEDSPSPYPYQKTSESLRDVEVKEPPKLKVAVIVALLIGALVGFMGGSLISTWAMTPTTDSEITIINEFMYEHPSQCGVRMTFELVNTGNADYFADVEFIVNGEVESTSTLFVRQGEIYEGEWGVRVDCGIDIDSWDIKISRVYE